MESLPFRARIAKLMQRSRRALRLYASVGKAPFEGGTQFTEAQAAEWKMVNSELLRQLSSALEHGQMKSLVRDVFILRDRFFHDWRDSEGELHQKQKELLFAAENGDFVRSALLSSQLVSLKARTQACQAAHHELDEAIQLGRVAHPSDLRDESVILPTKQGGERNRTGTIELQPHQALQERFIPSNEETIQRNIVARNVVVEDFPQSSNVIPLRRKVRV